MNVKILPNTLICLTISEEPGYEFPIITTVETVQRGMFTIKYFYSINGLAKVQCHGTSKDLGNYWLEFTDTKNNITRCLNITKLEVLYEHYVGSGKGILKTDSFIFEED